MQAKFNKLFLILLLFCSIFTFGQTPQVKSIKFKPQNIPISSPSNGEIYYADTTKEYFYWDGTQWLPFGADVTITNTSDLINDGDDGVNQFITLNDLYGSNAIIDAGVEYIQALDYRVWGSAFIINNVVYNTVADYIQGTVTLSDPHPTLSRFDTFILNSDTKATGSVTLTGGGAGSVLGITVNGVQIMDASVPFNTDLATTAIDVVTSINTEISIPDYIATNTGGIITIISTEKGIIPNTYVVQSSTSTITTTDVNMSGGDDNAHSVGVITGIPSATPIKPLPTLETQVEVSFRFVEANQANAPPGEFITIAIYDENLGDPDEWNINITPVGGDPASTTEFNSGAVSYEIPVYSGTSTQTSFNTPSNPVEFNTNGVLYFDIKLSGALGAGGNIGLAISDGTNFSNLLVLNVADPYGLDFNSTAWQTISIPLSYFNYSGAIFDSLLIPYYNTPLMYLDDIRTQLDTNSNSNNTWLGLNDTFASSYTGKARQFSVVNTSETGLELSIPNTSDLTNDGEDGLNPYISFLDLYGGNAIINGGVIYIPPNLDYYVWSTGFIINGQTYIQDVEGTVTLSDPDPINPRIDVFIVNSDTKATGTVTLTGGASGSVNSITVNGVELLTAPVGFNTDLATTAINVANNINSQITIPNYNASTTNGVITITADEKGIIPNGFVVVSSATTITTSDVNMSGGLDNIASVGVITGFSEVSPVKPNVNLETQVEVSFKIVQPLETSNPPEFITVSIYDENLGTPTEWDNVSSPLGSDLADVTLPYSNSLSINIPVSVSSFLRFNAGDTFPNNNNPSNVLYFALKTTADWTTSTRFRVKLGEGGNTSTLNLTRNSIANFGFQHTQHDVWQLVTIPIANYSDHFDTVLFVEFEFVNTPEMQMDFINAQYNSVTDEPNTYLALEDTDDAYTGLAGLVPIVNIGETALAIGNPAASIISTNTGAFNKALSAADTNVQLALETLDENVPNLQAVLTAGINAGHAENSGPNENTYIDIDIQDVGDNFIEFDFEKLPTVGYTDFFIQAAGLHLEHNSAPANQEAHLDMSNGVITLLQHGVGGIPTNTFNFITPTGSNKTISIPNPAITSVLAASISDGGSPIYADNTGNIDISSISSLSPFEAINEGNGIGFIIRGSDRVNAGNVGFGAFDLGTYFADPLQNASGTFAFNIGEDNRASGYGGFTVGYGNQATNNYNIALGTWSVASDFGSTAFGVGLISKSDYSVVVGKANIDYTHYVGFNDGRKPMFIVGNGTVAAGNPPNVSVRSDAFTILQNGKTGIGYDNFPDDTVAGTSTSILQVNGNVKLDPYGAGSVTGTATYGLAVDTNGEIIEENLSATEYLNEGSGIGTVLRNRNAANYGNIGLNSVDLSYSSGASATRGATGSSSFAVGEDVTAGGYGSIALGESSSTLGSDSFTVGYLNTVKGYGSMVLGTQHTVEGITATNDAFAAHTVGGINNDVAGDAVAAFGKALFAKGFGMTVVGTANLGTTYSFTYNTDSPRFIIGNGTTDPVTHLADVRSNAFEVWKNGRIIANKYGIGTFTGTPTFALNVDATGNIIEGALGSNPTGLEILDEGGGNGWRLIGRDPANYGNIGLNAVDISASTSASATRGATGSYSFASGFGVTASGSQAVAFGNATIADGIRATAFGSTNTATGTNSFVIGSNNTITSGGQSSFAAGEILNVSGITSHAIGYTLTTSGSHAISLNAFNFARSFSETSLGVYGTDYTATSAVAVSSGDRVFNVGNGTGLGTRADAFTILKNGAVGVGVNNFEANSNGSTLQVNGTIETLGYTVATLPTGTIGEMAYVTDATAPSYLATVVGGGAVVCPVFFNGTNWVCH